MEMEPQPTIGVVLAQADAQQLPGAPLLSRRIGGRSAVGWVVAALAQAGVDRSIILADAQETSSRLADAVLQETFDIDATWLSTGPSLDRALAQIPKSARFLVVDANRPALPPVVLRTLESTPTGVHLALRQSVGTVTGGRPWVGAITSADTFAAIMDRLGVRNTSDHPFCVDTLFRSAGIPLTETDVPHEVHPNDCFSIHNLADLALIGAHLRDRIISEHLRAGVQFLDPSSCWIDTGVRIGAGTVVLPGVHLKGNTRIGDDCRIGPYVVVEDASVANECRVGPFAHLRPGTELGDRVRIGNFVEVKNASLGTDCAAGHLTYLGDATIGAGSNIGAGTITCNFDGVAKHRTEIGEGAFIGSHSTLVAPVTVGAGAWTAAGSVVTREVPTDGLAIGRARQENREGWALTRKRRRPHAKEGGS